jgi:threonine/homoserine/homoserine lactone efflux protein
MIAVESFVAFCLAALALAVVPGPTVTVILSNSLRHGTRAGMLNVAGTVAAGLVWVSVAALGLTAATALMGVWFDVLRYAGAAYLVWLGFKLLRSDGTLATGDDKPRDGQGFFWQAFLVTMTNPKALVLFGIMIPPFLSRGGNATIETFLLGASFVAIASVTDSAYALLAGRARSWLSRSRVRSIEIVSGMLLSAGGIWMAIRGN